MTEDKIKRVQLILDYCDRGIMSAQIFANNTNTDINDVPLYRSFVQTKTLTLRMLKLHKLKKRLL